MQETRTFFQSKRKRMTQKFWEGRGDKAKTKQVAEMNRFKLAKTEWLSCSSILPCSSVGALNASPPTGEWSRQVNSAQLHPAPRWIKGENTDTPTCRKENKQVGKRREKKEGWAPTVWLVQIGLECFSSLLFHSAGLGAAGYVFCWTWPWVYIEFQLPWLSVTTSEPTGLFRDVEEREINSGCASLCIFFISFLKKKKGATCWCTLSLVDSCPCDFGVLLAASSHRRVIQKFAV